MATSDLQARKAENSRILRADLAEQREESRGMPEIIRLDHSNVCNLRCVICWHHLGVPKFGMSMTHVERIAHEVFPTARKVVLSTSGEPLLTGFDEIAGWADRYETKLEMSTSCLNMTEQRFRRTIHLFDILNVSMDCPDKAGYERVRLGSSYDRVVDNLRMMKRVIDEKGRQFSYQCKAALLASTVHHLPEFVGFAHDLGFDLLHVQHLFRTHPGLDAEDIQTQVPRADLDAIVAAASEEARRRNFTLVLQEIGYPDVRSEPMPYTGGTELMRYDSHGVCWFVGQSIGVNHAGEVTACCFPTDLVLGDATRQTMREIWNGRPMRRLRRQFFTKKLNPFCRDCYLVTRSAEDHGSFGLYRRRARLRWAYLKKDVMKRLRSWWRRRPTTAGGGRAE